MTTKTTVTLTDRTYHVAWDFGEGDIVMEGRLAVRDDGHLVRWNGFVCPYFTKAEIDRYIAWASDEPTGDFARASWSGDTLLLTHPTYSNPDNVLDFDPDYQPERVEPVDGLYAMGAWAWTWSVCDPDTDPDD